MTLVDVFKAACYCLSTFVLDEDVKKCFVLRRQSENSSSRTSLCRRRRPSAVAQFGKARVFEMDDVFQDCASKFGFIHIRMVGLGSHESLDGTTSKREGRFGGANDPDEFHDCRV